MAPAMHDTANCLNANIAQDGFEELLATLNPYVEELLYQPTFHLFMTLPAELRYLIYEQYFLDEKHSIACQNWPYLRFTQDYEQSIRLKRNHAPFLPSICLTSKSLQSELLLCLLEAAHFEFDDCTVLGRIVASLIAKSMHLHIRKATTKNVNGQRGFLFFEDEPGACEKVAHELALSCNKVYSAVINRVSRLRELNVTVYAPLLCTTWVDRTWVSIQALPFDNFLIGLRPETILGLNELQNFSITGIGGACNTSERIKSDNTQLVENDDASNLTSISSLCRQIKDGFTIRERNVMDEARRR
ncbi:hypothetical protein J4E91_009080 [Alternaria rosae]|nr:hypothetical protein J4E91_009080 [Alternaria rosae]